jgi:hypothetical protein
VAASPAFAGAELGPHVPLSQVLTPKRGSTQSCKASQTTSKPTGIKISNAGPPW